LIVPLKENTQDWSQFAVNPVFLSENEFTKNLISDKIFQADRDGILTEISFFLVRLVN